jgi:methyl-accepting chemotaxis protein
MFGKFTVAQRLALGFGLFFIMLLASVLIGLDRLAASDAVVDRIVAKDWQKTVLANDADDLMNANARETFLLFLAQERAATRQRIAANVQAIDAKLGALEPLLYKPEGKALLAEVRERRKAYVASFGEVARLLDEGRDAEASRRMSGETVPALNRLLEAVGRLIKVQGQILEEAGKASHEAYATARNGLFLFLAFMAVAAVLLASWIIRAVTRPLGGEPDEAKAALACIAQGDLTREIPVKAGDANSLLAAMKDMQAALKGMVGELKAHADGVAGAAQLLSATSGQLATSTSQQSEAAAGMAAAVEEMTVSINHVSDSASEARAVTARAGELSQQGAQVIQETQQEMEKIAEVVSESSQNMQTVGGHVERISSVVQVIKEVADQTNLLALNAAIEAARAGEQGRGFAVVADEVRKLAERTSQATVEIGEMIGLMQESSRAAIATIQEGVVARVVEGLGLADRASEAMTGIGDGTRRAVTAVNEISGALKEQSVASNEIASSVEKIAQMAEENHAATREAAETARKLESLALGVRAAVGRFRV